jgi:hypothetical protein
MSNIIVTSTGFHKFHVEINDDDGKARKYDVAVPEELISELGLSEDDLAKVVHQSFTFLLEREPASSIMPQFSLDVISRYFPDYMETLRKRIQS